jgi:prepilin-type N-terminal cleavage/methylation domain-containing protein
MEITMRHKQAGFTLIEIAIVLVIIGLLLGGVLKGEELITSARVRNLISQQDGVKAAFYGFQDRFRALPGDYPGAVANIAGISTAAAFRLPRVAAVWVTATAALTPVTKPDWHGSTYPRPDSSTVGLPVPHPTVLPQRR